MHNVTRTKHAYKFIVDDEWRFDPNQPVVRDNEGNESNFLDLTNFQAYTGDDAFFDKSKGKQIPTLLFVVVVYSV